VRRSIDALARVRPAHVDACALRYEEELRKRLEPAALARALDASQSPIGKYLNAAMRRLGNLSPERVVTLADGSELACRAVVIASGVSVRELTVPGAKAVTGAGLYYGAALTEAANYKGQHIYVVGGANSAGQGAIFLSQYAERVTMLVRSSLAKSMSQYLIEQIEGHDNIDVQLESEVVEIHGDNGLEAISIRNRTSGEIRQESTPAIFVFIGAKPHTNMLQGEVSLSSAGFVLTGPDLYANGTQSSEWKLKRDPYLMETSVPGVFAAGDVRHGVIRRVASAVGQGSTAISFVHEYLKTV
jgi:thioredoxin reductase (NADPH)